ncbi:unnamed protein product [Cyprideis torosa]|uniref:Uncharacterized protein n=1 Tax=Cyprideis torosa TaxID=163714 RepID=A0A7R8W4V4_9CRUS|nr:unnamed protein product [Cyprideis torosa]CAG0879232.1 unnamed protein product [Cyprideis torosa]
MGWERLFYVYAIVHEMRFRTFRNPLAQMEHDREAGEARINLEEQQLEEVFRTKVEEKKQKLKDHAEELEVRRAQMKSTIDQQRRELDEKRRQFEAEVREWEQSTGNSLEDLRRRSIEAASRDGIDGGKEEKHAKKKKKGIF